MAFTIGNSSGDISYTQQPTSLTATGTITAAGFNVVRPPTYYHEYIFRIIDKTPVEYGKFNHNRTLGTFTGSVEVKNSNDLSTVVKMKHAGDIAAALASHSVDPSNIELRVESIFNTTIG